MSPPPPSVFLCVLCCLILIDMFHIQMQLMQRLDLCNEYVCMYVRYLCVYLTFICQSSGLVVYLNRWK
jgi:hypothetical protein